MNHMNVIHHEILPATDHANALTSEWKAILPPAAMLSSWGIRHLVAIVRSLDSRRLISVQLGVDDSLHTSTT